MQNISLWATKHNEYSTREAVEFLMAKYNLQNIETVANFWGNKTQRKRWLKENLYYKLPLFWRPAIYFIYRYFLRFGFLDGFEGFVFHFLQGFWYRFLVDFKIYQIEKRAKRENRKIVDIIGEFLESSIRARRLIL